MVSLFWFARPDYLFRRPNFLEGKSSFLYFSTGYFPSRVEISLGKFEKWDTPIPKDLPVREFFSCNLNKVETKRFFLVKDKHPLSSGQTKQKSSHGDTGAVLPLALTCAYLAWIVCTGRISFSDSSFHWPAVGKRLGRYVVYFSFSGYLLFTTI